jgi:hypothetical protein
MFRGAGMFGSMLVRRTITAKRYPAILARPQVQPVGANLNAFFANSLLRKFDVGNSIDMRTNACWHYFFPSIR